MKLTQSLAVLSEHLLTRIDSELLSSLASELGTTVDDLVVDDTLTFDQTSIVKFRQAKSTLAKLDQKESLAMVLTLGRVQVAVLTSYAVISKKSVLEIDESDPLIFLRRCVTHAEELGKSLTYTLISTRSDLNSAIKNSSLRGFKAARKRFAAMLTNNITGTVNFDQPAEQIVADLLNAGLSNTITFSSCDYSLTMFSKKDSGLELEFQPRNDGESLKFICKPFRDRVLIQ